MMKPLSLLFIMIMLLNFLFVMFIYQDANQWANNIMYVIFGIGFFIWASKAKREEERNKNK